MLEDLWNRLRAFKSSISIDASHLRDDRNGRYQRAMTSLGRLLACGEALGYRYFEEEDGCDVCYLVGWHKEEYEDVGEYIVFRMSYSKRRTSTAEISYRNLIDAEICCFYDGRHPNPGRILRTREEAIAYMRKKGGYHETRQ